MGGKPAIPPDKAAPIDAAGKTNINIREGDRKPSEKGKERNNMSVNSVAQNKKLTKEDIPGLREQWKIKCSDLFQIPPVLPPFREVNHKIKLIDKNKWFKYCLP